MYVVKQRGLLATCLCRHDLDTVFVGCSWALLDRNVVPSVLQQACDYR